MNSRDVNDVVHKIVAVGSRSVDKAKEFIDREIKDNSVKPYGSYDELFADKVRYVSESSVAELAELRNLGRGCSVHWCILIILP